MSASVAIADAYAAHLRRYVDEPDERALAAAYDLGRRALEGGSGIVDIAAAHGEAIGSVLAGEPAGGVAVRAADFLVECLAPFEMALRGFREATQQLGALNAELERRVGELAQANAELEAFSYSVSHDLRAPLHTIDGFSRILLRRYEDRLDEQGRHQLERVRAGSQQMGMLIDEMLKLSRLTRRPMAIEPVDLSALAADIAEELRAQQPERRVVVSIQPGVGVMGDHELLRAALTNLLGNAFKFTRDEEEARIELGCREQDGERVLFVRDNGVGFDMRYADRLFRPFERLHDEQRFAGTGVGLATVQRVVRRHGGRIWAEGEVGAGATFSFTLDGARAGDRPATERS